MRQPSKDRACAGIYGTPVTSYNRFGSKFLGHSFRASQFCLDLVAGCGRRRGIGVPANRPSPAAGYLKRGDTAGAPPPRPLHCKLARAWLRYFPKKIRSFLPSSTESCIQHTHTHTHAHTINTRRCFLCFVLRKKSPWMGDRTRVVNLTSSMNSSYEIFPPDHRGRRLHGLSIAMESARGAD